MAVIPTPPSPTTCIYNTISISPSTSFVLPPGATIISVSDITSIASSCADLNNLETPECYIAKVVLFDNTNGAGEFFEADGYQCLYGYSLNSVDHAIGTCTGAVGGYYSTGINPNGINGNPTGFMGQLKAALPAITSYNGLGTNDGSTYNYLFVYQIKTIPSIGDNLEIIINASAENFITDAAYRVKFVKRANATGPLPPSLC